MKLHNMTISVDNLNIGLLKEQRDYLLTLPPNEHIEGLINLCDHMLDKAIEASL